MAIETNRGGGRVGSDLDRIGAARRHLSAFPRNVAAARAFLVTRRRDQRFRLVPFNAYQLANGVALAASAFVLLVVLLDPYLVAWHGALPEGLIAFFDVLTDFGRSGWILYATGIFLLAALVLDATGLPERRRLRRAVRSVAAGYVFVAVAGSGLLTSLLKRLIGRARPKLFEDSGSFSFDPIASDSDWASFPSGHATTAMSLGVALALLFPRLRWVFLCLGFWIAVSRMFVRAHYPSDVLAGCLIGGIVAWLLARALAQRRLLFGFDAEGRLHRRKGVSGRLL
jgi:undecaprenyl-diphosphatase